MAKELVVVVVVVAEAVVVVETVVAAVEMATAAEAGAKVSWTGDEEADTVCVASPCVLPELS